MKTKFSGNLFRLSGTDLGHVLQILDLRCSHALENSRKEDEMDINVDAIDPRTFYELEAYVKEKVEKSENKDNDHLEEGKKESIKGKKRKK